MILVSGQEITADQYGDLSGSGSDAPIIIQAMAESQEQFAFPTRKELGFEVRMRSQTIGAARSLQDSGAAFATFYYSTCNEKLWTLTGDGGFELNSGVRPADAIDDIFKNGELYAFECATAMMIIFYKALIESIEREKFNRLFQHIFLWDWQNHPFFPLRNAYHIGKGIPGDVRYFKNPQVNPQTPQWQGENAVDLSGGLFYGHGIGIIPAEQMIVELNKFRKVGATVSAFLMNQATRPDYLSLAASDSDSRSGDIRITAGTSSYTF
jgi:hypothetical protein